MLIQGFIKVISVYSLRVFDSTRQVELAGLPSVALSDRARSQNRRSAASPLRCHGFFLQKP
jgi:hypothetical protein